MFCTRCATFNPDDAFRCIGCGARLDPRERTRRSRQQSAGREHWFLVIPLGLALIALLFVGWRTWDAQRQQSAAYDRAMEALVTGDLTEAIAQFGRAGDYRDAAEQRLVTQQQRAAYQAAMLDAQIALDREETKHAVALLRSVVNALPDNADAATLLGIAEDRYRTELEQSITLAITQRAWLAAERAMLELAAFTGEPPDADALAALRLAHAPLLFTRDGILSRIGPDRADESVVMDDVPVAMPLWSPDRSKIAFFSVVTGAKYAGALFVVDADGSDLVLIDDRAMLSLPAWSPDSASIAYTGLVDPDDTGSRTTLAVADVGSGGKQHVPLPEDVRSLTSPSWSGDGGQLAAVAHKPTGGSIALVDTSSLEVSQPPIDLPVGIRAVSWSSSAPVLLVWTSTEESDWTAEHGSAIYLVALDDRSVLPVTSLNQAPSRPAWAPDGIQFAYLDRGETLHIRIRTGIGERTLALPAPGDGAISWGPGGVGILVPPFDPTAPAMIVPVGDRLGPVQLLSLPFGEATGVSGLIWGPMTAPDPSLYDPFAEESPTD